MQNSVLVNENSNKIDYLYHILGLVLYRLTLEVVYKYLVYPSWEYSGFTYDYEIKRYVISWIVLFINFPFIIKNYKKYKISNIILTILYVMAFIPGTVLMAFKDMGQDFLIMYFLYWIFIGIFNLLISDIKLKHINENQSQFIINIIICILASSVVFVSYKYTNFRLNFNIFNVYELREEAREFNMPMLLKYIYSVARTALPTLIVYKLIRKDIIQVFFLAFVQFLLFSIDGSKSVLFSLVLSIVGYITYKKGRIKYISWAMCTMNIMSIVEYAISGTSTIMSIFLRRVLLLPQLINYFYYDFFSKNEYDYFRQSILGKLGFESPYDIRVSYIIGRNYYGGNANNGLFSDAYYNLGEIGIVIMPILIILILRFVDSCSANLSSKILVVAAMNIGLNLISSSLFTVLLSHGLLVLSIILYLISRKGNLIDSI